MSNFIKTEIVNPEPGNFYRQKLCELRETLYRHMDKTGTCPVCLHADEHATECGFARIETELAAEARKKKEG